MKNTRYGLIGCGMMGQEHIQNIDLLQGAEVGAVFEPDPSMAAIAQQMAPDAVQCADLDALLAVPDLDCLLIVSPNFCHADQLDAIAKRVTLPILVEKPLFTDPSDGARVQQMGADYGAPIWVAMEYRYMPPISAFLDKVASVTGGVQMLTIREHRFPFLEKVNDWNRFNKYSGGTFVEKCCHFFDLMRVVLDDEPVRIFGSAGQAANHLDETYDGAVPDILDHGFVTVEFARGARAVLELCMFAEGAQYQEEISAVGPQGKIESFVPGPGRFWPKDLGAAPEPKLVVSPRHPKRPVTEAVVVPADLLAAGDHNGSTFYQHQKFLDVVRGSATPDVTLEDGWIAVAMGMAAQESVRTGESVAFAPFVENLRRSDGR